jgi:adenosylhomocysteine nucleosidase
MESAAIAQTCYINQKQFLSLRIISDVVGKIGQEEDYNNFWKNMPKKASEMVDIVIKAIPEKEIHF